MKFSRMAIYCFSGTGNTLHLARLYIEELSKKNVQCSLCLLPCEIPQKIENPITIMFPVYAQSAPPFIINWLSELPSVDRAPVVLVSTFAGCSGLVNLPLKRIFLSKNFLPYAIKEIRMPSNYITQKISTKNRTIIAKAEARIAKFADDLFEGRAKWNGGLPFSEAMQKISSSIFAKFARYLGQNFFADENICSKCALCTRLCPVSNIKFNGEKIPSWKDKCEQCLRCINFCPCNAVKTKSRLFAFLYTPKYICEKIRAEDFFSKNCR